MADDNRYRSTRLGSSYRHATQTPPANDRIGGSDPLAELARLIGKRDPYAEFGLSTSQQEEQERYSAVSSVRQEWDHTPQYQDDAQKEEPYSRALAPRVDDHPDAAQEQYAQYEDYQQPARPHPPESWPEPSREPMFDESVRYQLDAAAPHADQREEGEYVGDDPGYDPNTEQMYDDPPRAARRSGLAVALALIGCAVLGTAAAYGYRSYYGSSASSQPPPVITADSSTPTKIVPTPVGESGKAIQDRVANAGREQIVSKQEEPVALRDVGTQASPRVVLPAPFAPAPVLSQPPSPGAGVSGSNEPRKVRTVTIRPDGSDGGGKGVTGSARSSGGPISLDPQAQDATNAPAARTRSAAAPPPAARPPMESSSASSGGFLVQLSSQKTEAEAAASFRSLQAKFPTELGRRQPVIQRADLGSKGVFYRTMVGPFASSSDAQQFCTSFKAAGGHCVVPSN
jgi:hypothetical protein